MVGVGGCALGVWGSSGAVSCTLSTPEHGGASSLTLGCCSTLVAPWGAAPQREGCVCAVLGAHQPPQQQVLSGFNPFLRLGQEKGWRRGTESLQEVVGSLPKAVTLPGAVLKGWGHSSRVSGCSPAPV